MSDLRKRLANKLTKEANDEVLKALNNFQNAYITLVEALYQDQSDAVNQRGVVEKYPFDKSFDELGINEWVEAFKEYYNK